MGNDVAEMFASARAKKMHIPMRGMPQPQAAGEAPAGKAATRAEERQPDAAREDAPSTAAKAPGGGTTPGGKATGEEHPSEAVRAQSEAAPERRKEPEPKAQPEAKAGPRTQEGPKGGDDGERMVTLSVAIPIDTCNRIKRRSSELYVQRRPLEATQTVIIREACRKMIDAGDYDPDYRLPEGPTRTTSVRLTKSIHDELMRVVYEAKLGGHRATMRSCILCAIDRHADLPSWEG